MTKPANITAALRDVYRQCFEQVVGEVDGEPLDLPKAQRAVAEIARLSAEAGPLWAEAVLFDELRRFRWETARCGLCGRLGHALDEMEQRA